MFFLSGLLSAVIIVALAIVPALFLSPAKSGRGALVALGVVAIVVYTGVNWWIMWGNASAFGFSWAIYSQLWALWTFELAIIGVLTMLVYDEVRALSIAAIVLAGLMFVQGTLNLKTWAGWDASSQLATIHVTNHADPGEYPETDANHIVAVPIETARQLGDQAMNANNTTNTYYNPTEPALQSIAGHLYWVAMLEIDGWANYSAMNGKVPGYIVIDAENPGQPARYVDKNADGTPIVVNYQPSGMFEHHLGRHVRESGYPGELLGSWVLELDDNWRPYYTGSIDVLPSATFTGTVPAKTISVDAQTGEIKVYDLEDTPQWIDRIYSADTVKMILNWWGEWGTAGFAPIYWGNGNRFSVAKNQEPTLVYTKSGHPEWQVQMSAYGNGEAASHVVLFSGRDNKVDVYSIPSLQLESSAAKTVYQSGQNVRKNVPTHISLHKIYGKLTWVMPLVSADTSSNDDNPKPADKSSFQGIALMKAEGSSGSDIALDTTLAGTLAEYRNNVLRGGTTKPSEDSTLETAKGTVSQLSPVMREGELNVFYFRLGTDDRTYKMSIDPNDAAQTVERPFIKVGAKVAISYRNSGDKKGDVVAYDDLGM